MLYRRIKNIDIYSSHQHQKGKRFIRFSCETTCTYRFGYRNVKVVDINPVYTRNKAVNIAPDYSKNKSRYWSDLHESQKGGHWSHLQRIKMVDFDLPYMGVKTGDIDPVWCESKWRWSDLHEIQKLRHWSDLKENLKGRNWSDLHKIK